jgi:tRNA U55 pseudouridine synthase TruB
MKMGTGAYLTELRRTKIGDFNIDDAVKIEEVGTKI